PNPLITPSSHLLCLLSPSHSHIFSSHLLLFFFTDTPPTEIYTLSLHDALPICQRRAAWRGTGPARAGRRRGRRRSGCGSRHPRRSEEHTSELQSLTNLVCRLLLEKKKENK